jgi:type IV secretory pathway TrbF-like protein
MHKDMQEYSFIPDVKMDADTFWSESGKLAKEKKMDAILGLYDQMLDKATNRPQTNPIGIVLSNLEKITSYFLGVETWL